VIIGLQVKSVRMDPGSVEAFLKTIDCYEWISSKLNWIAEIEHACGIC